MRESEFVDSGRESWERLAEAAKRARRVGVAKMGAPVLRQMHEDYRRAAADLAYAQTHFPSSPTREYLNRLVGRAHGELYGAAPQRLSAAWRFLSRDYPRLLREQWRPIALAGAMLVGAAILGAIANFTDPSLARMLVPESVQHITPEQVRQTKETNAAGAAFYPLVGAAIGVNNVQVAIMAFAGGITFGALTVYAMLQNGAMIGVLAAMFGSAGFSLDFWALIVPHGALELPAIIIAGGAGLKMAAALLFPGDLPRGESLRHAAPVAARLLLGTVPLFAIAAGIEGFFTPTATAPVIKIAVGVVLFTLLILYVLVPGHGEAGVAAEQG